MTAFNISLFKTIYTKIYIVVPIYRRPHSMSSHSASIHEMPYLFVHPLAD
jgi:hypothetical protein